MAVVVVVVSYLKAKNTILLWLFEDLGLSCFYEYMNSLSDQTGCIWMCLEYMSWAYNAHVVRHESLKWHRQMPGEQDVVTVFLILYKGKNHSLRSLERHKLLRLWDAQCWCSNWSAHHYDAKKRGHKNMLVAAVSANINLNYNMQPKKSR